MHDPDAWLAIVNPASGQARGRKGWPAVAAALTAAGVKFTVAHTSAPHDGERIARAAVARGCRQLLAGGGDGSVNDVVNGIMQADAPEGSVTLAPVPLGTGNDWARSLGIARDPLHIAATIAAARTFAHDVGLIEFAADRDGQPRRRWFINVAGAGYDAHVIERLPRQVPSPAAYLKGALLGLATYRAPLFRIEADGVRIERRLLLAFAANARYCGNRMHVAPTALLDDGLLDVVAVRDLGIGGVLTKLCRLYDGSILGDPAVQHLRAARVSIDADPSTALETDGQIVGRTPAVITLRAGALRAVVAAERDRIRS